MPYSEPTWTTPEERENVPSVFTYSPPDAEDLTSLFVRWLQYHFADADRIMMPALKPYVWSGTDASSKIYIEAGHLKKGKNADQKPSITVKRLEMKDIQVYMDPDLIRVGFSAAASADPVWRHSLVTGAHALICEAPDAVAAEQFGQELYIRLMPFLAELRNEAGYKMMMSPGAGSVQKIEGQERFRVEVAIAWAFNHYYSMSEETAW